MGVVPSLALLCFAVALLLQKQLEIAGRGFWSSSSIWITSGHGLG